MKRKRAALSALLILATSTSLCGLILTAPTYAQSSQLRRLAGEWELSTRTEPNEKRLVTFIINNGQITGTYTDERGEKSPITQITFANGRYSFRVGNLVVRNLKFIENDLEGEKRLTAPAKGGTVPRVVRMVRVSHR